MVLTAEALQNSVVKFDGALNRFSDNTRDFSEFNHHLKSNIQRLGVALDDFSEDVKSNVKVMSDGYSKVDVLNETLSGLSKRDK